VINKVAFESLFKAGEFDFYFDHKASNWFLQRLRFPGRAQSGKWKQSGEVKPIDPQLAPRHFVLQSRSSPFDQRRHALEALGMLFDFRIGFSQPGAVT